MANEYIALRGIPPRNMVVVSLPGDEFDPENDVNISHDLFVKRIQRPVEEALRKLGLDGVRAWIYSVDFPVGVQASGLPLTSLQGATFTDVTRLTNEEIKKGLYVSPYFAGPGRTGNTLQGSRSFSRVGDAVGTNIPSMMLGYCGPLGNTEKTVLGSLRRGAMADATRPKGTVYLLTNSNIRAQTRMWQFAPVQELLQKISIPVEITGQVHGALRILGVMDGAEKIYAAACGRFVPGAVADHFTSFAARFDTANQSKMTDWISAGATATAGTVTEPYSLWTKFPSAFFYVHYVVGCSIIESYYQSVACPLQLCMIGDPLCTPWRPPFSVTSIIMDRKPYRGEISIISQAYPVPPPTIPLKYEYYLDGQRLEQTGAEIKLDTTAFSDGVHILRVVAWVDGPVIASSFKEYPLLFANAGKETRMVVQEQPGSNSVKVAFGAEGARAVGLLANGQPVAQENAARAAALLRADEIGAGPVTLQAYADFEGDERVFSETKTVELVY